MRSALPLTVLRVPAQEGNKTLTLALVWQLMRAYTLSLLAKLSTDGKPVTEAQIIQWANKKVFLYKGPNISSTKVKVFLLKRSKYFFFHTTSSLNNI